MPHKKSIILAVVLTLLTVMIPLRAAAATHTFAIGKKTFLLDGKPFAIHCGELHFERIPKAYWRERLEMCRAMGLNTVCVYLFWNFQEQTEGHFNWKGRRDAAEFCRLAQQEGLWVILRPGPYSCAEWEEGGFPWWLLRKDVKLRTTDPNFMRPARRYLKEVGRVLAPLQITNGGPILMVQAENEYGSYGKDPVYMGKIRDALRSAGFNVPIFACNPAKAIPNGLRHDIFQVVNFGSDPAKAFATLRKYQPQGPLMCGEYYPGWFDTWGVAHHSGTVDHCIKDLTYMLKHGESFSIYMVHGGTTFGLWSGADRHTYKPDTSSYDYDAPISEAGWTTKKFWRIRELLAKYQTSDAPLPEPLPANPVMSVAPFTLKETAPLFTNLPAPVTDTRPQTMEFYNQGYGCIDYRTTLPAGPARKLSIKEVHDYAWIFVDGRNVGHMDRRSSHFSVDLPACEKPARLDIFVQADGRINFGKHNFDRNGIHAPVTLSDESGKPTGVEFNSWKIYSFPLNQAELSKLQFKPADAGQAGPAFWRGSFDIKSPADTFLDLRGWSKGVVWVNGHCLGRYWDIGPTQTMFCPGPWLHAGRNKVIVLDVIGPRKAELAGLKKPILNELHPELDVLAH